MEDAPSWPHMPVPPAPLCPRCSSPDTHVVQRGEAIAPFPGRHERLVCRSCGYWWVHENVRAAEELKNVF